MQNPEINKNKEVRPGQPHGLHDALPTALPSIQAYLLPTFALVSMQDFPHRLVQGVAGDFAAAGEMHTGHLGSCIGPLCSHHARCNPRALGRSAGTGLNSNLAPARRPEMPRSPAEGKTPRSPRRTRSPPQRLEEKDGCGLRPKRRHGPHGACRRGIRKREGCARRRRSNRGSVFSRYWHALKYGLSLFSREFTVCRGLGFKGLLFLLMAAWGRCGVRPS